MCVNKLLFLVLANLIIYVHSLNNNKQNRIVIGDLVFPKCCPPGHLYSRTKRSCSRFQNEPLDLKMPNILLPNCKIVQDFEIVSVKGELEMLKDGGVLVVGANETFLSGRYCVDRSENGTFVFRACKNNYDVCGSKRCIRKCCQDGYSFINSSTCFPSFEGIKLDFTDRIQDPSDDFVIVHGYNCDVYLASESRYIFELDKKGVFSIYTNRTNSFLKIPPEQETSTYCIEHAVKKTTNTFAFFRCLNKASTAKFDVSRWAKILSCVCLIITLLVYSVLPELRNLFGKILICYSVAILHLFLFLVYSQFNYKNLKNGLCAFIGFNITFGSLSYFVWMNIICFDVWYTLGSSRNYINVHQKKKDLKRFIVYILYGFGFPLIWTLIIFIFYKIPNLPFEIKAYVGQFKCVFEKRPGNYAFHIFYITPIFLLIVTNLVLFVKTVTYCWKVKGEISKMKDSFVGNDEKKKIFAVDKERVLLVLKLSIIMGISFLFEVVSTIVDLSVNPVTLYIEVVWDVINCLQGLLVFVVFVCKPKIYNLIKTKLGVTQLRKTSLTSVTGNTHLNPTTTGSSD